MEGGRNDDDGSAVDITYGDHGGGSYKWPWLPQLLPMN
jgi:hypothetical protein